MHANALKAGAPRRLPLGRPRGRPACFSWQLSTVGIVHANAMKLGRDDRTAGQLVAISFEDFRDSSAERAHGSADKPNDSSVPDAAHDCKLAEILIQCNDDPAFHMGSLKQFKVARIARPMPCPDNIVSGCDEFFDATAPDT